MAFTATLGQFVVYTKRTIITTKATYISYDYSPFILLPPPYSSFRD